jgi:hypothetical protein
MTSQFHNCKDSIMRVVEKLLDPTGRSRDISQQAKGTIGIESTQIRWLSQWSGGGGCLVEHCSAEAKSLKTKDGELKG